MVRYKRTDGLTWSWQGDQSPFTWLRLMKFDLVFARILTNLMIAQVATRICNEPIVHLERRFLYARLLEKPLSVQETTETGTYRDR